MTDELEAVLIKSKLGLATLRVADGYRLRNLDGVWGSTAGEQHQRDVWLFLLEVIGQDEVLQLGLGYGKRPKRAHGERWYIDTWRKFMEYL